MSVWKQSFKKAFFAIVLAILFIGFYLLIAIQASQNPVLGDRALSNTALVSIKDANKAKNHYSLLDLNAEWVYESEGFALKEIKIGIEDKN